MNQRVMRSPIGDLLLKAQDGYLMQVRLLENGECVYVTDGQDVVLDETQRQLEQYFAGERKAFDLPLAMHGTTFETVVWQMLQEIPFGETMSYGELAKRLDKPSASRAVGGACSRNPLLIVVPCHRVIAASGRLTGFAAGLTAKRMLLSCEGWQMAGDRVKSK